MPINRSHELQAHIFRTPAVFKQAEIARIKGQLKAPKRNQSMAERYAKKVYNSERLYQYKLGMEIRKYL